MAMVKINTFGENLKTLRLERKINQQNLAQELNFSLKTISHWETGYSEPSIDQLIILANFFNVTIDELVGRE
ncbi:MAG: helix-turn-helix domain-containing protein [Candidatus Coproplasma sp.]